MHRTILFALPWALAAIDCDAPQTAVVLDNAYSPSATPREVVFRAFWQAVSFSDPVPPGASTGPQDTVAASENTAYVLLAPGWDTDGGLPPSSLVAIQSRLGLGVHLNQTLHIVVDDQTFSGNCAAGNTLSQAQADFITRLVFPDAFASLAYDAATCTASPIGDGGAP